MMRYFGGCFICRHNHTLELRRSLCGFLIVLVVFMAAPPASVSAAGRDPPLGLDDFPVSDETIRVAGYGVEKLSTVLVTGTLLCSFCTSHQLQPLPISGALLAVTCNLNSGYMTGNKKSAWGKGVTDENGEFIIDLPSHLHAISDLQKACSVKVLWLPKDSPCHSALIAAKDRVNEIELSSVGNGIRTYTAGTIQFLNRDTEDSQACESMAMEVRPDMSW